MSSYLPIEQWLEWLRSLYEGYGYIVVFLSALLENTSLIGFVMPGNSLVLLGAFYARLGVLNIGLVIACATLGTIIGYHIDFIVGRFFLEKLVLSGSRTRLGKRLRIAGRLRLGRRLIKRHGGKAILISHISGTVRSFVALSAGMMKMSYPLFLGYEVVAALLWNTIYAMVGYTIAMNIDQLTTIIQRMGFAFVALLIVLFVLWRFFKKRAQERIRKRRYEMRRLKALKDQERKTGTTDLNLLWEVNRNKDDSHVQR